MPLNLQESEAYNDTTMLELDILPVSLTKQKVFAGL